jgi:hypothetical protein
LAGLGGAAGLTPPFGFGGGTGSPTGRDGLSFDLGGGMVPHHPCGRVPVPPCAGFAGFAAGMGGFFVDMISSLYLLRI